jgi:hypothetical protein
MDNNEINKSMDTKQQTNFQTEKQPDEQSGIHLQGHIKIFNPETNEIIVQGRA